MQRFSRYQRRFTRTAALLFFVLLLVADGIVSFFYLRDQLSVIKFGWFRTFIPIVQVYTAPTPGPATPDTARTETPTPIPPTATPVKQFKKYTIQAGDTLFKIATANGLSVDELAKANGITNVDLIQVGQEIIIPVPGGSETPPAASSTPTAAVYPPPG